jgi:hypothetical protein
LPLNIAGSRIPEVPSKPDLPNHWAEHLSRIVDLEGRLSSLKHQTRTAMEQAKKSSDLLKKVSSLEDQMSILIAKIVQLKECDVYMTEIIKTACDNSNVSWSEPTSIFFVVFCFELSLLLLPRYLLGSCCWRSSSKRASYGSWEDFFGYQYFLGRRSLM